MSRFAPFLLLFFILFSIGCSKSIDTKRGFYYWQSYEGSLSDESQEVLTQTGVQKLYIKAFEVWQSEGDAFPASKSGFSFDPKTSPNVQLIPCVFIKTDVFANLNNQQLDELAEDVDYLLKKRGKEFWNTSEFEEVQIDCDWAKKDQDSYFYFLKAIKEKMGCEISCTIRLYPFKFSDDMGVPPVDRGMLMCYNLLAPKTADNRNSIFDRKEFAKYIEGADTYPVPLDAALPVYSNVLMYNRIGFDGITHGVDSVLFNKLTTVDSLWYDVHESYQRYPYYLRAGDRVKIEKISTEDLTYALNLLKDENIISDGATISLYHLDDSELKRFTNEELNAVFATPASK